MQPYHYISAGGLARGNLMLKQFHSPFVSEGKSLFFSSSRTEREYNTFLENAHTHKYYRGVLQACITIVANIY